MKKYLYVIKTELQRVLTYRADYFGFRIGNIFEIAVQVVIWTAIFEKNQFVNGYSYSDMITYIVMGRAFSFFTANFGFEHVVAKHIQLGELSNYVTKPMGYLKYLASVSIGRAATGLVSAVLMSLILIFVFSGHITSLPNISSLLVIITMLALGYLINLLVSILTGFIAFWTIDISGIFFSIKALEKFMAGAYFPVNLLPAAFVSFSFALPFVYTFYFPVQLFLGKISVRQGLVGLVVEVVWLFVLYVSVKAFWKAGFKKYESVGI